MKSIYDIMNSTRVRLLVLGLVIFVSTAAILDPFSKNLVNLFIYKSLVDDNILAVDRQKYINYASRLMLLGKESEPKEDVSDSGAMDMISLIYQGLHYYRNGMNEAAAGWFRLASESLPVPRSQRSVLVSPFVNLERSGLIVIEGNNPEWQVRSDSPPGTSIEPNQFGQSILSCGPQEQGNKMAAFAWNRPINIDYHHTMEVDTYVPLGSYIVIETVIDGELDRHVVHEGNNTLDQLIIPLVGGKLEHIYILVRTSPEYENAASCQAALGAIKLGKDSLIN